jgi:UDP-glucose 4-epimerase
MYIISGIAYKPDTIKLSICEMGGFVDKWLVTGGAGYIGSHVSLELASLNFEVIVIDNLSNGYASRLKGKNNIEFHNIDILDSDGLRNLFLGSSAIKGIIHLAALKSVEASMEQRKLYFENNIIGLRNLLECARIYKVRNFIFSSSAAVYGEGNNNKTLSETDLCNPNSVYGENKLIGEWLVRDYSKEFGLNSVSLRYFNVLGSGKVEIIDQSRDNILPKLIKSYKENKKFSIFGKDYPTRNGTCIRDYVDVRDLAKGHLKAALYLQEQNLSSIDEVINLGSGIGYSVLEVVSEFEKQIGDKLKVQYDSRRNGDPAYLVADINYALKLLNWSPKYVLKDMISSTISHLI